MGNPRTLTRTMQDTVSYKTVTATSVSGEPTYSALSTAAAKAWEKLGTVKRPNGEEVTTSHRVHTFTSIPRGALLWLPGEDTSDDNAGHIVDFIQVFDSAAVRGNQWTLYEILIEARGGA